MQIFVAIIFFYLFMISGNEPLLWVHTLNIKYDIGFLYGLFILFVLVASSNAVNLTDGLDGLATGLSIIAYFTFGLISWNTGWLLGYQEIAIFCFIMVGSLLGFLVFNSHPAKIFMGDTGSLALGATLGSIAILTRHELLLVIIGIVFVIETLSVILQVSYFKLTHGKRLFKMAPLHHTLEKMGYKETDIVTNRSSCLVSIAIDPKVAPSAKDPVSPINILAG
jgi:phospho-N-acetylmuramoyl-pentapeptide-transferase